MLDYGFGCINRQLARRPHPPAHLNLFVRQKWGLRPRAAELPGETACGDQTRLVEGNVAPGKPLPCGQLTQLVAQIDEREIAEQCLPIHAGFSSVQRGTIRPPTKARGTSLIWRVVDYDNLEQAGRNVLLYQRFDRLRRTSCTGCRCR